MGTSAEQENYDAIVVGARCAGAATAMRMAQQGMRVLAVDRSAYGSDTRSTHALMRPAVQLLDAWGVLDRIRAAGTPTVRTTTFHYDDERVSVPIRPQAGVDGVGGVDGLYAPRRTLLDAALVDAARQAGAEVQHGVHVQGLLRSDDGRVGGVLLQRDGGGVRAVRAKLVVGADGINSGVARQVGSQSYRRGRHGTAGFYTYYADLPTQDYHWYFKTGSGAGAIATNDGLTLVFVAVTPERFERELRGDREAGFLRILAESDAQLADVASRATRHGGLRGFPQVAGFHRVCQGPGWALVGDAGYFRDPLTAHGITDAFRDAELLARAAVVGTPRAFADYQATRDELSVRFSAITDEVAAFEWDTQRIKALHLEMSREMKRELRAIEALAPPERQRSSRCSSLGRASAEQGFRAE